MNTELKINKKLPSFDYVETYLKDRGFKYAQRDIRTAGSAWINNNGDKVIVSGDFKGGYYVNTVEAI